MSFFSYIQDYSFLVMPVMYHVLPIVLTHLKDFSRYCSVISLAFLRLFFPLFSFNDQNKIHCFVTIYSIAYVACMFKGKNVR